MTPVHPSTARSTSCSQISSHFSTNGSSLTFNMTLIIQLLNYLSTLPESPRFWRRMRTAKTSESETEGESCLLHYRTCVGHGSMDAMGVLVTTNNNNATTITSANFSKYLSKQHPFRSLKKSLYTTSYTA